MRRCTSLRRLPARVSACDGPITYDQLPADRPDRQSTWRGTVAVSHAERLRDAHEEHEAAAMPELGHLVGRRYRGHHRRQDGDVRAAENAVRDVEDDHASRTLDREDAVA